MGYKNYATILTRETEREGVEEDYGVEVNLSFPKDPIETCKVLEIGMNITDIANKVDATCQWSTNSRAGEDIRITFHTSHAVRLKEEIDNWVTEESSVDSYIPGMFKVTEL
jgi:hypothetical protein